MSPAHSPRETQDDLELMARILERDPSALETLFDRHSSAVLGLCLRILGDRVDAEEALVDVFHQIWERAERFDRSRASPLSYLMMVARSRAIDHLRARQRRTRLVVVTRDERDLENLAQALQTAGAPPPFARTAELRSSIGPALELLSPEQREAIDLSFSGGLTHREIAEQLGAPLGTVKTRIRQALIRLRDNLQPDHADLEVG